jgi:GDP-4-dehydro-6-deoxy-D-mannose reductase
MSTVLVTGINGFVGKHLANELHSRSHKVYGVGNAEPQVDPLIEDIVENYYQCDLTDKEEVSKLPLNNLDAVINLAGLAAIGPSFKNPDQYLKVNVGVLNTIGELLVQQSSKARVIAVSSGALYNPSQDMPLTESSSTDGSSPYAVSKLKMEEVAVELRDKGLDCIIARPFNHIGPGQNRGFLLPDLYERVKGASANNGIVTVGNLKTKRDYTDVRDIVRAYADLALKENLDHILFNVCSGKSHSGQEVLDTLLSIMDMSGKIKIEVDKSIIRPNDPVDLYGSSKRLAQETDWLPEISFEQTIKDFVNSKK